MLSDKHPLTTGELEAVVEWFLYRADPEQRLGLMADLPQLYAKLHPGVDPATITAAVERQLVKARGDRNERLAAHLDSQLAATCTCYKGHRDDLDNITGSIAGCEIHGGTEADPR